MKLFVLMFVQLFLLSLHSRFANRAQYLPQFIVSMLTWFVYCNVFAELQLHITDWYAMVAYSLGAASGGAFGVWVHRRFFPMEEKK